MKVHSCWLHQMPRAKAFRRWLQSLDETGIPVRVARKGMSAPFLFNHDPFVASFPTKPRMYS